MVDFDARCTAQIHPTSRSSTSEDLEDAIRNLTGHVTHLAYTVATRDRQAHRFRQ